MSWKLLIVSFLFEDNVVASYWGGKISNAGDNVGEMFPFGVKFDYDSVTDSVTGAYVTDPALCREKFLEIAKHQSGGVLLSTLPNLRLDLYNSIKETDNQHHIVSTQIVLFNSKNGYVYTGNIFDEKPLKMMNYGIR